MKESGIEFINKDEKAVENLYRKFVQKEFITDKDLDQISLYLAEIVKQKIKPGATKAEVLVIIETLTSEQLLDDYELLSKTGVFSSNLGDGHKEVSYLDENDNRHKVNIHPEDLAPFLEKIKFIVFDKLSSFLDKNINLKKTTNKLSNRVYQLDDNQILKEPIITSNSSKIYPEELLEYDKSHIEALEELHKIPEQERSPYVYFGTEIINKENLKTINQYINLTTIIELVDIKKENKPHLEKIMHYFLDILKGHDFLISHNLFLTDNALQNLGVNLDKNTGILFDFDGLEKKGSPARYVVHWEYFPPERTDMILAPINEGNIIYELGIGLRYIHTIYKNEEYAHQIDGELKTIHHLLEKMIYHNPAKRPNIKETIQEIENLIKNF